MTNDDTLQPDDLELIDGAALGPQPDPTDDERDEADLLAEQHAKETELLRILGDDGLLAQLKAQTPERREQIASERDEQVGALKAQIEQTVAQRDEALEQLRVQYEAQVSSISEQIDAAVSGQRDAIQAAKDRASEQIGAEQAKADDLRDLAQRIRDRLREIRAAVKAKS